MKSIKLRAVDMIWELRHLIKSHWHKPSWTCIKGNAVSIKMVEIEKARKYQLINSLVLGTVR